MISGQAPFEPNRILKADIRDRPELNLARYQIGPRFYHNHSEIESNFNSLNCRIGIILEGNGYFYYVMDSQTEDVRPHF